MNTRTAETKSVVERIESFEAALARAREYLKTGKHGDWFGFRPLFVDKLKDGKQLPPHPDWVKNVFIPSRQRALLRAEKVLERLESGRALRRTGDLGPSRARGESPWT